MAFSPARHSEGLGRSISGLLICAGSSSYGQRGWGGWGELVPAADARPGVESPTFPSGNQIHSLNSIDWGRYSVHVIANE